MTRLHNLSVALAGHTLVQGVTLDLPPGSITALVGESGSGKSMTALAVIGLLPEAARVSGQVLVGGQNLLDLTEAQMCAIRGRRIGMIFQEPMTALNPLKTIGDQVAETLSLHQSMPRTKALERAAHWLARVGLPQPRFPLTTYPHQLSGGQRQRVAIAMAVALRPDLLIADEPTTALDVTTQAQILDLLRGLVREEGMALLLITHDLAVVAGLADQVAIMERGRIVETGPAESVYRTRSHPYTRQLLDASRHVPQRRPRIGAPLLEVHEVTRRYRLPSGQVLEAVDRASLTIAKGESLGLVGSSGCGKSTLTRAILGLDSIQGGTIRLGGQPIHAGRRIPAALRARMQVVFQDPFGSFDPRWRVERLVAEPFHLTGRPPDWKARVAQALEEVGLSPSDAGRHIHEFSGGQRQRLAIARALIIRPDLIVLDEAVSALDVRVRAQILDLLADLGARHGLAMLFISHDLGVIRGATDRVAVMDQGRIVETGPTAQVITAPSHPSTRRLVEATPRIPDGWLDG